MSIEKVTGLLLVPVIYTTLKGIGNKEGADGFGFVVIGEDNILTGVFYKRTQTGIFLKLLIIFLLKFRFGVLLFNIEQSTLHYEKIIISFSDTYFLASIFSKKI